MPIYIATIYPVDPNGRPTKPLIRREEASSEEEFVIKIRDWWVHRYGVDAEPDFGPISLAKDQS